MLIPSTKNFLRKLDLTSLRLFVAVCREKNIGRAAEREFIAPSAISRRISELENMIGAPLIERRARGIAVTPVGETVLRHALAMLGAIESLAADLSKSTSGAKRLVKMAGNLSSIMLFLPEVIAAYQHQFPEVRIDLAEHTTAVVMQLVDDDAADFGICNAVAGIEQFESLPYRSDSLCVLVPSHHRLAHSPSVAFSTLLGEDFISLPAGSALTQLVIQAAAEIGAALNVKFWVSNLDALCSMVDAGLGIAIMPQEIAERYAPTLKVQTVALSDAWAVRHLRIIFKRHAQLSSCSTSLMEFIAAK